MGGGETRASEASVNLWSEMAYERKNPDRTHQIMKCAWYPLLHDELNWMNKYHPAIFCPASDNNDVLNLIKRLPQFLSRVHFFFNFHRMSFILSATTVGLSRELSSSGRMASRQWLNILFVSRDALLSTSACKQHCKNSPDCWMLCKF